MTTVLQGPFLTRAEAAVRAGVDAAHISHRPDLLRLDGRWLEEVYFAFQFAAAARTPSSPIGCAANTLILGVQAHWLGCRVAALFKMRSTRPTTSDRPNQRLRSR